MRIKPAISEAISTWLLEASVLLMVLPWIEQGVVGQFKPRFSLLAVALSCLLGISGLYLKTVGRKEAE